jgi:hypothetical protein
MREEGQGWGELRCCGRPLATSLVVGVTVLLLATATIATIIWDGGSAAYRWHFADQRVLNQSITRPSVLGTFQTAAVAVDGQPCAQIARWGEPDWPGSDPREVLLEGGHTVDAALAALFCNGEPSLQLTCFLQGSTVASLWDSAAASS